MKVFLLVSLLVSQLAHAEIQKCGYTISNHWGWAEWNYNFEASDFETLTARKMVKKGFKLVHPNLARFEFEGTLSEVPVASVRANVQLTDKLTGKVYKAHANNSLIR